jgi:hypothetical protein
MKLVSAALLRVSGLKSLQHKDTKITQSGSKRINRDALPDLTPFSAHHRIAGLALIGCGELRHV